MRKLIKQWLGAITTAQRNLKPTAILSPGDHIWNTTEQQMEIWNGVAWVPIAVGGYTGGSLHLYEDFIGTVVDPMWTATLNGAGNINMLVGANSVIGGAVRLQDTGAAGANDAALSLGTNRGISVLAGLLGWVTNVRVGTVLAGNGTRVRAVMHNNGAYGAVGDWFGFEFDAAANANWRLKGTSGGGAVSNQDTGVPVVAGQFYLLAMAPDSTLAFRAYIDGVYVGTLPLVNTTPAQLEPLFYVDDGGLAAGNPINYDVDLLAVWQ
jgi:hypothetical protein